MVRETKPRRSTPDQVDRSIVIGSGLRWCSGWALRLMILVAALWVAKLLLAKFWVGVLPLVLAILISSVLWPLVRLLRRLKVPATLAALIALLVTIGAFGGAAALAVPQIVDQAPALANNASGGIERVQDLLQGPPLNLDDKQINDALASVQQRLQESGDAIAGGAFAGVTAVGSFFVTTAIVLILTFMMLKDGPRFLPMVRRLAGEGAGGHLSEVFTRIWTTLSAYLRTQALVSAIDAVFIGAGLLLIGVPLAIPLAILTFIGGFIPIVGAVAAGALAVLVALVTNGPTDALLVLGLILLVQQLEGNVLSPILQGKSMQLHPAIVLLSVTAGGTWFGITGAFLAVPIAAAIAVVVRYVNEQVELVSGSVRAEDLNHLTDDGAASARHVERQSTAFRRPREGEDLEKQAEKMEPEVTLTERLLGLKRR